MFYTRNTVSKVLSLAALVALAGCGGSASQPTPAAKAPGVGSRAIADKVQPTLYVSDYGTVNLYSATGNPNELGQIGRVDFPYGLYVNKRGDLYIANSQASNVLVYHRGAQQPFATLSDPSEYPYGVTEDSHETVFVANAETNGAGAGDIAVYPHGKSTASTTFADPKWYSPVAIASDAKDNLYVCFNTGTSWGVDKFAAGTTKPIDLKLKLTSCWGIVVDKNQNLVVADRNGKQVDVFPPGATTPSHTFPVAAEPFAVALSSDAKDVFVSDYADDNVSEYTYPAGSVVETIDLEGYGEIGGVAVDPPAAK
jgi:hypothetical protein